jgi:hypothetical protein
MYRYGLKSVGAHSRPARVRAGVLKVCAVQIEFINALIPPEPEGKLSVDVERGENARKEASKSADESVRR